MRPFFFGGVGVVRRCAVLVGLMGGALLAQAAPVEFTSTDKQTALIELYTSEGCSSCPPAERWLGQLRDAPGLWRDFVPVEFHVDYWNRLGWPDKFSRSEFTQRQYALSHAWVSDSVYTPCLVRDGAEWRSSREIPGAPSHAATVLSASYDPETGALRATFARAGKTGPGIELHAALLGGGIVSRVTAGENFGETLKHEFVALALAQGTLGADGSAEILLPKPKADGVSRYAVAVWVTGRGSFTPLQATGGWVR